MKPMPYSYFLLLLLPLVTAGLQATQCQASTETPPPSKPKTVTKQEKALAATNKLAGIPVLENLVAIYAGFEIDEMLAKAQSLSDMYDNKPEIKDVRRERLAVIQKMEVYNKDNSSAEAWTMMEEGEKMEKKGDEMVEQGYKEIEEQQGLYMKLNGNDIKNKGINTWKKGYGLLKKKYTTLMQGHGSDTDYHWEYLASIVRWSFIDDTKLLEAKYTIPINGDPWRNLEYMVEKHMLNAV